MFIVTAITTSCLLFLAQLTISLFHFQIVVAPPLFRQRPFWYQKDLAQIASRFSMAMSAQQPGNLHLLPSFVSQDLQPDGGHLTPVSGLHYILHLFDQSESTLSLSQCNSEIKLGAVQESVRQHDDRLSYLESRHKGLHDFVNVKAATDAEFKDWTINRNEEDWLTILGAPRLGQMQPREWQAAARRQVHDMIKSILRTNCVKLDFSVLYVGNPVRGRTTGTTVLNVRLNSSAVSSRIRELYSGFFRKENPISLPSHFRGISFRNKVTLATRIRLRILRELGNIFVASNPGSSFKVQGFDPRPVLITIPARGSDDRQRSYNFVEAVTTLPASFSDEALAAIFQIVGTHFEGELKSLFIVINDDERDRCLKLVKDLHKSRQRSSGHKGAAASLSAPVSTSGKVSGLGSGAGLDAQFLESLRSAPPPPPGSPMPEPPHRRKSGVEPPSRAEAKKYDDRDQIRKRGKRSRRTSSESTESDSDVRRKETKRKSRKGKKKSRRSRSSSSSSSGSGSGSSSSEARTKHR